MTQFNVDGPQALSRSGLRAWYGVSDDQVTRILDQGLIPFFKIGTQVIVPLRALEAFEDEMGREVARLLVRTGEGLNG